MTNPPAADEPAANAAERAAEPVEDRAPDEATPATSELPAPAPIRTDDAADTTDTTATTADLAAAREHDEPRFEADYVSGDAPAPHDWPSDDEPVAQQPPEAPPSGAVPPPPPGATPPPPPGSAPPPPPPPGGSSPFGTPPPFGNPPFGTGFNRALLVRPREGRYVAGVCAAIGRATNTDPTLWRVIFAVLTLAGGVSIVAYLLGWLLLPAEGDTGSPLEALLGRGRSTTTAPAAVVIGVCAVLAFLLVMSQNFGAALVGLGIVIGVVALIMRGQGGNQQAPAGPFVPPAVPNPPQPPFAPAGAPFGPAPFEARPAATGVPGPAPSSTQPFGVPSYGPAPSAPEARTETFPAAGSPVASTAEKERVPVVPHPPLAPLPPLPPLAPLPGPGPAGYRAPFAPHGPYAASSPYAASLGAPPPGMPGSPYPGLAPTPPPKRPREKSKLGRITFSLMVLSIGVLVAIDVITPVDFKVSTFFAVPLAITALGLITGAWLGRARVLILLGALLSIALAIATAASVPVAHHSEGISIAPASVNSLSPRYETDWGDINADLSRLDLADQDVSVAFRSNVGDIHIVVPPKADVTVQVHIQGGDCKVFGNDCGGFKQTSSFTDYGSDGQGGGKLHLDVNLQWGDVRVNR